MSKVIFHNQEFICPHCQIKNKFNYVEVPQHGDIEITYCDEEEGGCGTQIVVEKKVKTSLELIPRKIEGIEMDVKDINVEFEEVKESV